MPSEEPRARPAQPQWGVSRCSEPAGPCPCRAEGQRCWQSPCRFLSSSGQMAGHSGEVYSATCNPRLLLLRHPLSSPRAWATTALSLCALQQVPEAGFSWHSHLISRDCTPRPKPSPLWLCSTRNHPLCCRTDHAAKILEKSSPGQKGFMNPPHFPPAAQESFAGL